MSEEAEQNLLSLTSGIVSAHVFNNSVHASDLPSLISTVHAALSGLGAPAGAIPAEPKHKPAVSTRKSLASDDHIISMIDGKPYRTLRRHLSKHGLTDKEYRARYNLPADYPMVAKAYSATRKALAKARGLGRSIRGTVGEATTTAAEKLAELGGPAASKSRSRKKPSQALQAAASVRRRRGKVTG